MRLGLKAFSVLGAALASMALGVGRAQASLLGSTATFQYYAFGGPFTYPGSQSTFTVDGTTQVHFGMDQKFIGTYFEATVKGNEIEYDYMRDILPYWGVSAVSYNNGGIVITNGALFSFKGAPEITAVTLNPTSTVVPGLSAANVMFNNSQIGITWPGLTFHNGDKIILDVSTAPVPEADTYAMMLAGLGLLGFAARRRKRKEAASA